MSVIKPLPSRKKVRTAFTVCSIAVIMFGCAASYLKDHGRESSLLYLVLFIALVVAVALLILTGRPFRCPDCGKFLRDEASHPRAHKVYLYYCKRCDVIWDSAIERSSG